MEPKTSEAPSAESRAVATNTQRDAIHVLPQLLGGIAWAPLQDGLPEMRVLFELLGFLLKTLDCPFLLTPGFQDSQAFHGKLMPKAPSPIYNTRVLFDLYR
jgi:hypothetical protein